MEFDAPWPQQPIFPINNGFSFFVWLSQQCNNMSSTSGIIYSTSPSYTRRSYMAEKKTPRAVIYAFTKVYIFLLLSLPIFPLSFNDKVALLLFSFSEREGGREGGWLAGWYLLIGRKNAGENTKRNPCTYLTDTGNYTTF